MALPETGDIDAGEEMERLWRQQNGNVAFNKIDFAKSMATKFDPDAARAHSNSFTHFWTRIKSKTSR